MILREAALFDQAEFEVRCEWGTAGLHEVASRAEVVIIVDVLTFTTAVDVAAARGAAVFPFPWMRPAAAYYAASIGAVAAGRRGWVLAFPAIAARNSRGMQAGAAVAEWGGAGVRCRA
jgi:hypothetical protein